MEWRWLVIASLTACTAKAPPPVVPSPPPTAPRVAKKSAWTALPEAELMPVRNAVGRLRELAWQQPVPAFVAERSVFAAWLTEHGIVPHAGVEGAYLDGEIRLRELARPADRLETLAHELVHALEVQHGVMTLERKATEADVARHSLHEGVAIAIASAIGAERDGLSPRRTIAEHAATLEEISVVALAAGGPEAAVSRFPYAAGAGFAGALYATGGAAAWNAAEEHPPRSLVEVLHPKLYLAGFSDAPQPLVKLANGTHDAVVGWMAQGLLERELGAVMAADCMNDYRGADAVERGGTQWLAVAFATPRCAALAHASPRHPQRVGHTHVVFGPAQAFTALPARTTGSPPLARWTAPAPTVYPLGRDPADAFAFTRGAAKSTTLGIEWEHVEAVVPRGLATDLLGFGGGQLASVLLVRLPRAEPVESELTLLVQAFVGSEVDRVEVHDEPPIVTPAGTVYARRVDTATESAAVALLPRCENRYALAVITFSRELPFAALRTRLGDLRQTGSDVDTATCKRVREQDAHDFTPR